MAATSVEPSTREPGCDEVPTCVAAEDHCLHFKVPTGLMPDPQFGGRPAEIQVRRPAGVRPQ